MIRALDYYNFLLINNVGQYHDFFSSMDEKGFPFHELKCENLLEVMRLQNRARKQIVDRINPIVACQSDDVIVITNSDFRDLGIVRIYFTSSDQLMVYKLMEFDH